jgi:hypothetical protein
MSAFGIKVCASTLFHTFFSSLGERQILSAAACVCVRQVDEEAELSQLARVDLRALFPTKVRNRATASTIICGPKRSVKLAGS